ncbi:MAG TPA: hypothetical protein VL263_23230 [Vicinamibacterales bacterium]|nr:hypothetical protein [Vicinamibacterales bacterium]
MSAAPMADLDTLVNRRVFFGHQSVGANILDGVRDLLNDAGRNWPIIELGADSPTGGALMHAKVGTNQQPLTKCDDFRRIIDERLRGEVDVAVLKFCYIDIEPTTDYAMLCDRYRATLEELAARHPNTVFVPATVPLGHAKRGLDILAREMLGRANQAKLKNLARHAFNERLRQSWTISPLFDLARAEATAADGTRDTFTYRGSASENLVGSYTDDGGHLNTTGRRAVAAAFLQTLAAAAHRK